MLDSRQLAELEEMREEVRPNPGLALIQMFLFLLTVVGLVVLVAFCLSPGEWDPSYMSPP